MDSKKILVIERDPVMRFALSRVSLGRHLKLEHKSLSEALDESESYAAILADDSIMFSTGERIPVADFKDKFKAPIILMTSSGHRRIEGFARQQGVATVLFKPFSMGDLRKQVWKLAGIETAHSETHPTTAADQEVISPFTPADFGGRIADDKALDQLFVELERRQPLQEGLDAFDVVERHLIKRALQSCESNQSRAARFLGITRNTLRKRIKKYGLSSIIASDDQQDDSE